MVFDWVSHKVNICTDIDLHGYAFIHEANTLQLIDLYEYVFIHCVRDL